MQTFVLISSLLLLAFKSSHGSFTDNVDQWTSSGLHQLSARGPLPNTGYWNYLLSPFIGLVGRVLHFLVTDTRGFGNEIKKLDAVFKKQYGENEYVDLEREIVESFPYGSAWIKGQKLLNRVSGVRNPETGLTLGDAFEIIQKISKDSVAVKEFIKRWGMIEHVDSIFTIPEGTFTIPEGTFTIPEGTSTIPEGTSPAITHESLKKMRDTLLNNPKALRDLFTDPEIMSRITSAVLQSLPNINWAEGIDSAKIMIEKLKNNHPELIQATKDALFNIRDERTQLSFAECLQTLANIMKTPEFANKFRNLANKDNLILAHEAVQQIIPELLGDDQALITQRLNDRLATYGFTMPPKTVADMLAGFADGSIFQKVDKFFKEAAARPGGLTAENVEAQVRTVGITDLNQDTIAFLATILAGLNPQDMSVTLKENIGLDVPTEEFVKFKDRCVEIARSTDQLFSALPSDYTPEETPQSTSSMPDETTQ